MGIASFSRNAVVEIDGARYLLFRKVKETVWQLEKMGDRTIIEHDERALNRLFINGKLKFIIGTETWGRIERIELSDAERHLIEVRRKYVLAIANLPVSEAVMEGKIREVWSKIKQPETAPSWTTVYRWKKRYFAFGEDGAALLDKKAGKRDREETYDRVVVEICDDAINELYLCLERGTIQDVLDRARQRVKEEQRRIDEERSRAPESHPEAVTLRWPSRRLIKRLLAEKPEFDKYAARHGHQAAIVKFRSVRGHDVTSEPLQEAQLDHTLLDLFVVDEARGLPLGRPYLTVCIDNYTRCILGIYIGFIPPSSLSVALCLKDAFLPKDFKDLYPMIQNELPHGVPRRLKLDNGLEMHGDQLEQGCLSLGITIAYCPRRKPWYKAKVERVLRTLNDQVSHRARGTTFSNIFEKGDYNPEKFAEIRLSTVREGIRKWIADIYHQRPHRVLGVSPAQMWRTSITPDSIRVPHDPRVLDAVMGRPDTRKLTHKGIEFKKLQYNSTALRDLRLKEGSDLWVDIRVNEEDLGRIYVIWNNSEVLEATALNFEYADGITAWQHKKFQEYQSKHKLPDNPEGWLEAKEAVHRLFTDEFAIAKRRRRGTGRHFDRGEKSREAQSGVSEDAANNNNDTAPSGSYDQPVPSPTQVPARRKHFTTFVLEEEAS